MRDTMLLPLRAGPLPPPRQAQSAGQVGNTQGWDARAAAGASVLAAFIEGAARFVEHSGPARAGAPRSLGLRVAAGAGRARAGPGPA